jgi:hypothetical protein
LVAITWVAKFSSIYAAVVNAAGGGYRDRTSIALSYRIHIYIFSSNIALGAGYDYITRITSAIY